MTKLTPAELRDLTSYSRPAEQLAELHRRGFPRACIDRLGRVVLERAHYEAVCRGEFARNSVQSENDRPKVKRVRNETAAAR